jgi:hypothetical protein
LDHFLEVDVGNYSSTMVRIWVWYFPVTWCCGWLRKSCITNFGWLKAQGNHGTFTTHQLVQDFGAETELVW